MDEKWYSVVCRVHWEASESWNRTARPSNPAVWADISFEVVVLVDAAAGSIRHHHHPPNRRDSCPSIVVLLVASVMEAFDDKIYLAILQKNTHSLTKASKRTLVVRVVCVPRYVVLSPRAPECVFAVVRQDECAVMVKRRKILLF